MSRTPSRPIVLLAEDSEDDAFFFRWSLQKAGLDCELIHVWNGEEAVRALARWREAPSGERPGPDLVFLDLKMPTLTGFEVLEWIRQHPFNPPLDVAVLSGSEHSSDIERAKALGASAYFTKPISAEHLRARFEAWQKSANAKKPADCSTTGS